MSSKATKTQLKAAWALASVGGKFTGRSKYNRPGALQDYGDTTWLSMEKKSLVTLDKIVKTGWHGYTTIKSGTLTRKGWALLNQKPLDNWHYLRAMRTLAARVQMVQWLDEAGATPDDMNPENIIRDRFGIDSAWQVTISAHFHDASRLHVTLTRRNLIVKPGQVYFARFADRGSTWLAQGQGRQTAHPGQANLLAGFLESGARIAAEMDKAADERGYIQL